MNTFDSKDINCNHYGFLCRQPSYFIFFYPSSSQCIAAAGESEIKPETEKKQTTTKMPANRDKVWLEANDGSNRWKATDRNKKKDGYSEKLEKFIELKVFFVKTNRKRHLPLNLTRGLPGGNSPSENMSEVKWRKVAGNFSLFQNLRLSVCP